MKWPTKDNIIQTLVNNLIGPGKKLRDLANQWLVKHLIIAFAEAVWTFIIAAKEGFRQTFVQYATGEDLDERGYERGVYRKEPTKAVHRVILHKANSVKHNTPVPDLFMLTTKVDGNDPPLIFRVIPGQQKYIPVDGDEVEVLVECESAGELGNVPPGSISLVAQAGFDSVTDSQIYNKGTDQEDDDTYRERILERMRNPPRGGTISDYRIWAKEVPGCYDAIVLECNRGGGTVDIIPIPQNGFPTQQLVDAVTEHIRDKRPAGADPMAILPEENRIDVIVSNCKFREGYDIERSTPIIHAAIESYIMGLANKEQEVKINRMISVIERAHDEQDALKEPILLDFELQKPVENIKRQVVEFFVVGNITIEE